LDPPEQSTFNEISESTYLPTIFNHNTLQGLTYHRPDGNRLVEGQASLPSTSPIDIELEGIPIWVAAVAYEAGTLWSVTLADGTVQGFSIQTGNVAPVELIPNQLPPGMPPLLWLEDGVPSLLVPQGDFATNTHPVLLNEAGDMAYLDPAGNLIVQQSEITSTLAINALPDARLLVDEEERLVLLTDPTSRYAHGVLGDRLEAGSITLVATQPEPVVVRKINIAEPDVIEGISPIWADLNGDGVREIIVTHANSSEGARIVVYDESGVQVAAGPAIGRGNRWRHQLAVAPFGPAGELELVDVLTPHIGGTVEFYRWEGDALTIVAQHFGYTSHVIGTRNLDMAVAGDFDSDGKIELLLPTQQRRDLGAIVHTEEGATVAWSLPVGGLVVTNLAAATLESGEMAVGVGRSDGVLRIWQRD